MVVYRDKLSGDEVMSDAYTIKDSPIPGLWEIDGKEITIGDDGKEITGANPSTTEGDDDLSYKVVDIVRQFMLTEIPRPEKKEAMIAYRNYFKALARHAEQTGGPPALQAFEKEKLGILRAAERKILDNWRDYTVYISESAPQSQEQGMWILMNLRDDGSTPYFTIWKDGLDEEKE